MDRKADKILGSHSKHELKRLEPIVSRIESLRSEMMMLSNEKLQIKTKEFKQRLLDGESLDSLLPEAFAAMREADRRVLGMEPFHVQILGGIILHQGRVAELKTGEGKTLTATLPIYLNALAGKNVMVVTVNDYLAVRDAEEMRPAYEFMGLTVSALTNSMKGLDRKAAYACDITYVTNSELGFDYLRDNLAKTKEEQVLRGLNYALIDEADSILIDEARTPLIISGEGEEEEDQLSACDRFVKSLQRGNDLRDYTKLDIISGEIEEETGDYAVSEKDNVISLTEKGIHLAEDYFQIENLMSLEHFHLYHHIQNALRANFLMQKDRDYIVKDGNVLIVDEFTGRILPGRRFSDGLHQALESKEQVAINTENETLATITFQSFFNHFTKKSGMTGTGITAEKELRDVYGMDVVQIPTNRPVIRNDLDDRIYQTAEEKECAIVAEIKRAYGKGQPILVGTKDIKDSETLSELLIAENIPHTVLNAKQDHEEAEIIAKAGVYGAVTIATNMAGRGTDIKLTKAAKEAGGLYVIGTERSESRRIDDQLIGRSGRQGDPGMSRFFLSLDDELLKLYAPKGIMSTILKLPVAKNEPMDHPSLTKAVANAQKNMELTHAAQRMQVLKYDEIIDKQRDLIYKERQTALDEVNISEYIKNIIRLAAKTLVEQIMEKVPGNCKEPEYSEIKKMFSFLPYPLSFQGFSKVPEGIERDIKCFNPWIWAMQKEVFVQYVTASAEFNSKDIRELERWCLVTAVDFNWSKYLNELEYLKQGARLEVYAQHDPVTVFKSQSSELFERLMNDIRIDTVQSLMNILGRWLKEKKSVGKIKIPSHAEGIVREQVVGGELHSIRVEVTEL